MPAVAELVSPVFVDDGLVSLTPARRRSFALVEEDGLVGMVNYPGGGGGSTGVIVSCMGTGQRTRRLYLISLRMKPICGGHTAGFSTGVEKEACKVVGTRTEVHTVSSSRYP